MRYVVLDLETTGLDPTQDHILEIGAITVPDIKAPSQNTGRTFHAVCRFSELESTKVRTHAVQEMHVNNGLWKDCRNSLVGPHEKLFDLYVWLSAGLEPDEKVSLIGDSPHFDLNFLTLQTHVPVLREILSHRVVDVSGMSRTLRQWGLLPELPKDRPPPKHRAMDDCRESLRKLVEIQEVLCQKR